MPQNRRHFLEITGKTSLAALLTGATLPGCSKNQRPNILWLIAEDFGPDLGCYGIGNVRTPNLDKLAQDGIRFTNAFTTAPVCSASRSAFMTGMYQTSIDAHHHRSHRDAEDAHPLPEPTQVITEYFRQAGYYTSNCRGLNFDKPGKTDWNFTPSRDAFDGTDWRNRKEGQPFFAQVNFSEVHRMGKRPEKLSVDPETVDLPPHYPDHPITRQDWAMYLSATEVLDQKVGKVLERLEADGLSDNTIVLFFGDHGRNHVRGKQWLYDGGIRIPLIMRWPGKLKAGKVDDQMVSAIDFAPTCLDLAGIKPPDHLEGQTFLGPRKKMRETIVAARDRCDGTEDRIRCVRSKQYKYIRNYFPDRPYTQYNRYKDAYYPVLRLMHRMHKKNELTPEQALFMSETRPAEELYDLSKDPHELNNLAGNSEYEGRLAEFRGILESWIQTTGDRGQIPENPAVVAKYKKQMQEWAKERVERLHREEGD